ncbi:N4-gp56 family major capsid protein [Lysinibacillus capsici]|uniref:N4-gp56 family major capsid protein n=1 Tax=Lysinibacillus capsici TaxID=2115968 RepID=UPI0032E4B5C8
MTMTKMANMVNPEVLKDMISAELDKAIRFAPLARVDRTLVGRAGNTVTVPRFEYIGDAVDVEEGEEIPVKTLSTSTQQATIKKAGIAVELSDETLLSGHGDIVGESVKQIRDSIANKIDNDALEALATTTLASNATGELTVDVVEAAQDLFNDEDQEDMVLICSPKHAAQLRKDAAQDWARASELGDNILVTGVFGEVLGAQVVRSKKLDNTNTAYLVKRGALAIYLKRDVEVESDRDILTKSTVISADEHYGVVLEDESKAVKINLAQS